MCLANLSLPNTNKALMLTTVKLTEQQYFVEFRLENDKNYCFSKTKAHILSSSSSLWKDNNNNSNSNTLKLRDMNLVSFCWFVSKKNNFTFDDQPNY